MRLLLLMMLASLCAAPAYAQDPVAADFQKVTLDDNTQNPMELDVAPDGRVFYIERDGRLMICGACENHWPDPHQDVLRWSAPGSRAAEHAAPDFRGA